MRQVPSDHLATLGLGNSGEQDGFFIGAHFEGFIILRSQDGNFGAFG